MRTIRVSKQKTVTFLKIKYILSDACLPGCLHKNTDKTSLFHYTPSTPIQMRVYLITNLQHFVCLVENDILYYFNYISELYDSCLILFYYYYCHIHRAQLRCI